MTSLAVAFGLSKGGSFNAAAIGGFFNTPGRSGQYDYSVSRRADPGVKALEYLDLLFLIARSSLLLRRLHPFYQTVA
ncbi:MAG: hypothetical protein PHP44_01770 [Kiritimatiellae bacterium]|nr:hypothetical protein [Kiritimatiellia bacterium]